MRMGMILMVKLYNYKFSLLSRLKNCDLTTYFNHGECMGSIGN